ncbi:hypothetical protein RRF57_007369 [Xylaria bambusicola]|uniref:Uncharacterized protein n=1 Tax=Xylaria bambusicola TaxID=326684 RepID=A0AAN7YZR3_9PEZI
MYIHFVTMFDHSAALVAFAVALSLYVHWTDQLSVYAFGAFFALLAGRFTNVYPLVIALVLFITSLICLLALIVSSQLFVISVFLPSLLAAYTGQPWYCFWLGQLVCHIWMNGQWGIFYLLSQYFAIVSLKATCSSPRPQAQAWTSISRSLNVNLDSMASCIHAYQTHLHPAILLLSECFCQAVDKVVYITAQLVKTVVWAFTQSYHWCPDWKIEEIARARAEREAKRRRERPSREALRRQYENTFDKYHSAKPQMQQEESQRKSRAFGEGFKEDAKRSRLDLLGPLNPFLKGVIAEPPKTPPFSPGFLKFLADSSESIARDAAKRKLLELEAIAKAEAEREFWDTQLAGLIADPTPISENLPAPAANSSLPPSPAPIKSSLVAFTQPPRQSPYWSPALSPSSSPVAPNHSNSDKVKKNKSALLRSPSYNAVKPAPMARAKGKMGKTVRFADMLETEMNDPKNSRISQPTVRRATQHEDMADQKNQSVELDESMDVSGESLGDPREELGNLFKALRIRSELNDEPMNVNIRPPALSWIIGDTPFIPQYFRAVQTPVFSSIRRARPIDTVSAPAAARHSNIFTAASSADHHMASAPPVSAPRSVPVNMVMDDLAVPTAAPPITFANPPAPAAPACTFSALPFSALLRAPPAVQTTTTTNVTFSVPSPPCEKPQAVLQSSAFNFSALPLPVPGEPPVLPQSSVFNFAAPPIPPAEKPPFIPQISVFNFTAPPLPPVEKSLVAPQSSVFKFSLPSSFSPPVQQSPFKFEAQTASTSSVFNFSASGLPSSQQCPAKFTPPIAPPSAIFDFNTLSFTVPTSATPTTSALQTAPTANVFTFTGVAAPASPQIDEQELEKQLLAEFEALSPKQPTLSVPVPMGGSSQNEEITLSEPRPDIKVPSTHSLVGPAAEGFLLSPDDQEALFGPIVGLDGQPFGPLLSADEEMLIFGPPASTAQPTSSPSQPSECQPSPEQGRSAPPSIDPNQNILSAAKVLHLSGPPPTSEAKPSPPMSELTDIDDDELNGLIAEDRPSYPPPPAPEVRPKNWSEWTQEEKEELDKQLMGIGHVPGPEPTYADDPIDIAKSKHARDRNPRAIKRRQRRRW